MKIRIHHDDIEVQRLFGGSDDPVEGAVRDKISEMLPEGTIITNVRYDSNGNIVYSIEWTVEVVKVG